MPQPDYFVPALEKGLDILEALARARAPLSQIDLARRLKRKPGEIFRMLNCLQRRGYLIKDEHLGAYTLSLKLYQLAHNHSPLEQLILHAAPPMRALARETRESCHLSVLNHGGLMVLAQAESPAPLRFSVEVGGRFSSVHTASGRLLLAHLPPEQRTDFLRDDRDYARLTPARKRRLRSTLKKIRADGCSYAENETLVGARDIAMLVGRPGGKLMAALAVSSLIRADGTDRALQLRAALRRCAAVITRTLGLANDSPSAGGQTAEINPKTVKQTTNHP